MKTLTLERQAIYMGNLILVDSAHPLREKPREEELCPVDPANPRIYLNKRAASMLEDLTAFVGGRERIRVLSGYSQSGYPMGSAFGMQTGRFPESETGLALDLAILEQDEKVPGEPLPFEEMEKAFWEKAPLFGFIRDKEKEKRLAERLGKGKIKSGRFFGSLRYVGYPHSRIISQMDFSLKDYLRFLKDYPMEGSHYDFTSPGLAVEIFYRRMGNGEKTMLKLPGNVPFMISGNNMDGFIITLWR